MSGRTITLITKHDPLTPVEGDVGLLLECAPDAGLFSTLQARSYVGLFELIGDEEDTKRRAYELTCKILADEPESEGVRQLLVIREPLIQALQSILHTIHLDNWLQQHGITRVCFRGPSPYALELRNLQRFSGSTYEINAGSQATISNFDKVREQIRFKGWRGLVTAAVLAGQRQFPCHSRLLLAMPRARRPESRGGWWFFTTAYTYTNAGLAYEAHLPRPLQYLYESSGTGKGPLSEQGREGFDVYAWARWRDIPSNADLDIIRNRLVGHICNCALEADEDRARRILLDSDMFQGFLHRILPVLVFHARILNRWLKDVSPEMILVGNPAWEAALLQQAQARGIPTVVLQHGILGDYYQYSDQAGDVLLVRGEFWRNFVADRLRRRTAILNVPAQSEPVARRDKAGTGKILFLSSIENALPHCHASDVCDILTTLLRVADRTSRTLIVRVHPRESVGRLQGIVQEICRREGIHPPIEYSQGAGLKERLLESAVAVTYCSTVFLDCLRLGIPIVSFDWHNFSYKTQIEKHHVFHFARSLADLDAAVTEAVAGRLPPSDSYTQFLAPTTSEEIQGFFERLLMRADAAPGIRA